MYDERSVLLEFLQMKRDAVVRTADGLTDEQARWRPDGKLIAIAGIINHLTHVEWRWIDGRYLRQEVSRSESEFTVEDRSLADVLGAYRDRWTKTDAAIRDAPSLDVECRGGPPGTTGAPNINLRWVVVHLIEETAHHAGHADSTRELLDGSKMMA